MSAVWSPAGMHDAVAAVDDAAGEAAVTRR
jgi:hypothetical protein